MTNAILVLNAGSSSIKFSLFTERGKDTQATLKGVIEGLYTSPRLTARDATGASVGEHVWESGARVGHDGAMAYLIEFLQKFRKDYRIVAIGHRVAHGGTEFAEPVLVDENIVERLKKFTPLAPLHQPHNLKPIALVLERMPSLPQVACFDTAFHRTQSETAQAFALPAYITDRGVKRYGFHGLSYEYIASVLPDFDIDAASGNTVVAHLGNGDSMCAMRALRSVATTMGFTAVDGLPMGTRCGSIDPGVILYLIDELHMDTRAIEKLIYQQSGLLGVSGVSSDMRTLLDSGDAGARRAVDLFVYRVGRELGSLAAALHGVDALVFTGGIGERSAEIRQRVCRDAVWLGLELNATANNSGGPRISSDGSGVSVWVIPTNEELMIARHTHALLSRASRATTRQSPARIEKDQSVVRPTPH